MLKGIIQKAISKIGFLDFGEIGAEEYKLVKFIVHEYEPKILFFVSLRMDKGHLTYRDLKKIFVLRQQIRHDNLIEFMDEWGVQPDKEQLKNEIKELINSFGE